MGKDSTWTAVRNNQWAPGAMVAVGCGIIYLALRPPLFDSDGYYDLLSVLGTARLDNVAPVHLLTVPIQILLVAITGANPYPSIAPFQIVGIALNCIALFFFCALLVKASGSRLFAVAASLMVAFSPKFWYVGFQNKPYPLLCLAFVLYLYMWSAPDEQPPTGLRLVAAGLCMAVAILIHQAAVFLIAGGALALLMFGNEPIARRIVRAVVWGAGTAGVVAAAYLYAWWLVTQGDPAFLAWVTKDLQFNGALEFKFPTTLIQSVMGLFGTVFQDDALRNFLDENVPAPLILTLYASLGVLSCVVVAVVGRWTGSIHRSLVLVRTNALFTVCLLSILLWSMIVVTYEPVYSTHWVPVLFPVLACLGLLLREQGHRGVTAFAIIALLLTAVNGYLNWTVDQDGSRNAPERLVAAINQHLGKGDLFVVLANEDWYGDIEYELLFNYLGVSADQRGKAILNDFVLPAHGSQSWIQSLRDQIHSTLEAGGRVYIAAHVLDSDSYKDLSNSKGAFAPKGDLVASEYGALDGQALLKQIKEALEPYDLEDSDFKLGSDEFFVIQHRADQGE